MSIPLDELLVDFPKAAPASEQSLQSAEKALGKPLPADYRAFLLQCNGGEGFMGRHYLILWKAEKLAQFNQEYQVPDYAPGLLMFGSSGGGEGFAFDTRMTPYPIVQVPFVGMSLNDAIPVADSFGKLLEKMIQSDGSLL
jgi:hypothetical protein